MTLKMDLDGITVTLKIWGWRPSTPDGDWTSEWCKTDFSFRAESWLDYSQENWEVFLSREIEDLYSELGILLRGELAEPKEMEMMEPDFSFVLRPARDLRDDPRMLYVREGCELVDIGMDWRVSFWHEGLTANCLSVYLLRSDIEYLHTYLGLVIGKITENSPEVQLLLEAGILLP